MSLHSALRHLLLPAIALIVGLGQAHAADSYDVDKGHAFASFRVQHATIGFSYGRFNDVGGAITWDNANPAAGSVNIVIQADSVDTGIVKRDQHLKSPDFFDAKQFATLSFKSTAIKGVDAKNYEVTGDLTIHNVTKSVTVKIAKTGEGDTVFKDYRVGFETVFTIKRSDFGMTNVPSAGDEVTLTLSVEGIKKK